MRLPPALLRTILFTSLFFSGSTCLIYELLWTRVLSFSLGSTSMAFASVLAVFFLGLAGGSMTGGWFARRIDKPLLMYGFLELAIGAFGALAFPLLFKVQVLFNWFNAGGMEASGIALRLGVAAACLTFPTFCMGATLPLLLEHVRRQGSRADIGLAYLYGINTLGAFFGVYLATHWLIPHLGLDRSNYVAVGINLAVCAVCVITARFLGDRERDRSESAMTFPTGEGRSMAMQGAGLLLLAASGFSTLAYEVVWGRILTIALEGSLYGFGATLGSFLAGIGIGGLLFSLVGRWLEGPAAVFRAYVVAALCMVAYLSMGKLFLPMEGYLLLSINSTMRDLAGLHLSFLTAIVFLLPVTVAFGFMFPAAVSLYNHGLSDQVRGAGMAYGVNNFFSVLGSLLSASVLMDKLGIEGIVYLNVFFLLLSLGVAVMLLEKPPKIRSAWLAAVVVPMVMAAAWWPSIDARIVLNRMADGRPPSLDGLFHSLATNFGEQSRIKLYKDGVGSTLTVTVEGRTLAVQSNGLPQSGRGMDPPHYNFESTLVGLFPALYNSEAKNALVVGLGAGITVDVLRRAGIPRVEVLELEPAMPSMCKMIFPPGKSPLDDTGVVLRVDDARNFLVRNKYRHPPRTWSIIASQPAHPWVSGAADLFTEDMFRLAYAGLDEGGVFCQWFMPTGIDERAFASICNAFGAVFDQLVIYKTTSEAEGFYFVGMRGKRAISLAGAERVFQREGLRQLLSLNGHPRPEHVLKYALMGNTQGRTTLFPGQPSNRDRNAFIESQMPLIRKDAALSLAKTNTPLFTGPLPSLFANPGAAESLFVYEAIDAMSGSLPSGREGAEGDSLNLGRLRLFANNAPRPYQNYYQAHVLIASGRADADTVRELAKATSDLLLRNQLRFLALRKWTAAPLATRPEADLEAMPAEFKTRYLSQWALNLAEQGHFAEYRALASRFPIDSSALRMAGILEAGALGKVGPLPLTKTEFDEVYTKILTQWVHKAPYLKALEWYCQATGRIKQAQGLKSFLASRAQRDTRKGLERAELLKRMGDFASADSTYGRLLKSDPTLLEAYRGLAGIYGFQGREPEFHKLVEDIGEVFPMSEVYAFRLKESYDQGQAMNTKPRK